MAGRTHTPDRILPVVVKSRSCPIRPRGPPPQAMGQGGERGRGGGGRREEARERRALFEFTYIHLFPKLPNDDEGGGGGHGPGPALQAPST